MFEIERKFLIGDCSRVPYADAIRVDDITQGFMLTDPAKVIRVRIVEELIEPYGIYAYLTVKGKSKGISRLEIETKIDFNIASELLINFCQEQKIIEKVRYTIPDSHDQLWEVDQFRTNNRGLVIAEIELESEDQEVILPLWVASEVTNDHRYSNASLSQHPWPFEFDPTVFESGLS
jgi:adenylate cyclase